jgi:hypothetical protein
MRSSSDSTGLSPEKRALLALLLQEGVGTTSSIPKRDPSRNAPLSFSQQRLWFLDQLEPDSSVYNITRGLRMSGPINSELVEQSFREIWRRHEALRTSFPIVDGEPIQAIAPADAAPPPVIIDLSSLTPYERDTELSRLLLEESKYIFDLSSGPLVRYGIVKSSADDNMLIFTMHHIVGDGWSLGILFSEFGALYKAFSEGSKPSLAPLDIQYPDYAAWHTPANCFRQ